jgi:hypothetical protein
MKCVIRTGSVDEEEDRIVRGEITKVMQVDPARHPLKLRIFGIDEGRYYVRLVNEIYALPEEFKTQKSICVKMVLANLKPRAGEVYFPGFTKKEANSLASQKLYTGKVVLFHLHLSIGK